MTLSEETEPISRLASAAEEPEHAQNSDQQLVDPLFIALTRRLRQIAHELDKHSKYLQERYGVTIPQLVALREIHEHGPISFSMLTRLLSLNNSTVTGIVDRLERQGLVRRTRTSQDRRRIDVVATGEGLSFLERTPPPIQESLIRGLEEMSPDEVERILWSIDTIVGLLHQERPEKVAGNEGRD